MMQLLIFSILLSAAFSLDFDSTVNSKLKDNQEVASSIPVTKSCSCGQSKSSRIVGGRKAEAGKFPFMAQILFRGTDAPFCGGALISNSFVLTAAHCTKDKPAFILEIKLGALKRDDISQGRTFLISSIIDHPNYTTSIEGFDLSLLKLSTPVDFTGTPADKIRPVCLPISDSTYENASVVAIGWGRMEEGGAPPKVLQEVNLSVVSDAVCRRSYEFLTSTMICASASGKDTCQGDSGGPLVSLTPQGSYDIIGVTSFGRGCARPNYPGVYTRITALRGWIAATAKDSVTCTRP